MNPDYRATAGEVRDVQAAARSLGMQINVLNANTTTAIDAAFATLGRERPDALFVGGDPFLLGRRKQVVPLAASHSLPTIYPQREYVDVGGLMSYGTSLTDGYRQPSRPILQACAKTVGPSPSTSERKDSMYRSGRSPDWLKSTFLGPVLFCFALHRRAGRVLLLVEPDTRASLGHDRRERRWSGFEVSRSNCPGSHGCIRLHPANAAHVGGPEVGQYPTSRRGRSAGQANAAQAVLPIY
jgi:hypothetical protein